MTKTRRQDEKTRRGEARRALATALRRIQADCKACNSAEDWYDQLKPLRDDLEKYQTDLEQHLAPAQRDALKRAMELAEATRAGIDRACETLEKELKIATRALPAGAALSPVVIAVILLVAVVAGTVAFANQAGLGDKASVTVSNRGCPAISLTASGLPGIGGSVATDRQTLISVPSGDVVIDARQPNRIVARLVGVPGASAMIDVPGTVSSIGLDGIALPITETTTRLAGRSSHTLEISCR